jgi:hypothetical protein
MKRNFSALTLKDALLLLEQEELFPWDLQAPPRPPSAFLTEALIRFRSFDTANTEAAKLLLIDAVFAEIVPNHPNLKVWKAMPLESDTLIGVSDYLVAPRRAYLALPLLCVAEAKRDDFVQGRAQCLAEMVACRDNNRQEGHDVDAVFGIVSNGQVWQFYKLAKSGEVYETDPLAISDLPRLLGALDLVCAECARQVP